MSRTPAAAGPSKNGVAVYDGFIILKVLARRSHSAGGQTSHKANLLETAQFVAIKKLVGA